MHTHAESDPTTDADQVPTVARNVFKIITLPCQEKSDL
jgi:hypothetical protein